MLNKLKDLTYFATPWWIFFGVMGAILIRTTFLAYGGEPVSAGAGYLLACCLLLIAHVFRTLATLHKQSAQSWKKMADMVSNYKNELYDESRLLIAPGDVADKLSILRIKRAKIEDKDKRLLIIEEISRTRTLMDSILDAAHPMEKTIYQKKYAELTAINLEQWGAEDRVRTEQSWEAAVYARNCNTSRVAKKNEINALLHYPVEVKDYKES